LTFIERLYYFADAMFIDLRKTPEGSSSAKVMLSFSNDLRELGQLAAEFPATVSTQRYGSMIRATVEYECSSRQECARCCSEFELHTAGTVSFILRSSQEEEEDGELDEYVYESEDDKIDFSQTVYDDFMVQVPVQPLCYSECKGFESEKPSLEIEHPANPAVDARWSALTKLKNK